MMLDLKVPLQEQIDFFTRHGELINFRKDQFLVTADEPSKWMFLIKEGYVKTCYTLPDGNVRILGYFTPGVPFAQLGSFFGMDSALEYQASVNTLAYRVPQELFFKELKTNKDFSDDYIQYLLRAQMHLADRIVYQGEKNVYKRTVRWLLFMNKYYGAANDKKKKSWTIEVPLTQETAANFMYLTRESASKAFRELSKKKLITTKKKLITIPDIAKLTAELK